VPDFHFLINDNVCTGALQVGAVSVVARPGDDTDTRGDVVDLRGDLSRRGGIGDGHRDSLDRFYPSLLQHL